MFDVPLAIASRASGDSRSALGERVRDVGALWPGVDSTTLALSGRLGCPLRSSGLLASHAYQSYEVTT